MYFPFKFLSIFLFRSLGVAKNGILGRFSPDSVSPLFRWVCFSPLPVFLHAVQLQNQMKHLLGRQRQHRKHQMAHNFRFPVMLSST